MMPGIAQTTYADLFGPGSQPASSKTDPPTAEAPTKLPAQPIVNSAPYTTDHTEPDSPPATLYSNLEASST